MPSQHTFTGIVLKKTKLGEADLIVSLLTEEGSCAQVVARGARKPKNSFASRLELFSCVELFCAQTKGLPLVQEARLINAHTQLRLDFERSAAASLVAELIAKATHENVPTRHLFDLCNAAFQAMAQCSLQNTHALALATCLKVCAFVGIRPRFSECVSCGVSLNTQTTSLFVAFSSCEGGYLCAECAPLFESTTVQASSLQWLETLLFSTLEQVTTFKVPAPVLNFGFQLVQDWVHVHINTHLKSIPFLLTNAFTGETPC